MALSTVHGDLLWADGGWPGSCHEQALLALSGLDGVLDAAGVAAILDGGFRSMAKGGEHWHAPVRRPASKDRLSDGQRAFNRVPAGLRALVEQAIGHLASAWALRRWRGLLYQVREVFRAAGALVCLGRWLPAGSSRLRTATGRSCPTGWSSTTRLGSPPHLLPARPPPRTDRPPELTSGDLDTPVGQALVWLHRHLVMDVSERVTSAPTGGVGAGEVGDQADDDLWERVGCASADMASKLAVRSTTPR